MTVKADTIYNKNYQPFIKWVGGKRGLLSQIIPFIPKNFNNYHEPFLGGGAMFFELYSQGLLKNKKIYLSDINLELINTYIVIKNTPNELINSLKKFKKQHSKEFYYKIRELDRKKSFKKLNSIKRATRFIYLNKTCFNGLYRVNKKGYFNTPIGSYKNPNIADSETILNASEALKNVTILHQPFNKVIDNVTKNDLVYFDPPYYPLNTTSNFTTYNHNSFLKDEQFELFKIFEKLSNNMVKVIHSNSDTEFIKNLYKEYEIIEVPVTRLISCKDRPKITELLIKNF